MRNRHAQKMYSAVLTVVSSTCTPAPQQNLGRPKQDQQIEPNRKILEIKQIVREFFRIVFDRSTVAQLDLGPSGRARPDRPAERVERDLLHQFVLLLERKGSGADEIHVSPQDVVELWKFVQTSSAQPTPHSSATLVVDLCRFE